MAFLLALLVDLCSATPNSQKLILKTVFRDSPLRAGACHRSPLSRCKHPGTLATTIAQCEFLLPFAHPACRRFAHALRKSSLCTSRASGLASAAAHARTPTRMRWRLFVSYACPQPKQLRLAENRSKSYAVTTHFLALVVPSKSARVPRISEMVNCNPRIVGKSQMAMTIANSVQTLAPQALKTLLEHCETRR